MNEYSELINKIMFLKSRSMRMIYCILAYLVLALNPDFGMTTIKDSKEFSVIRLTGNSEELNEVLYFTNNGFTRDEKGIVYDRKVRGKWQLMHCDLATYEITQLTEANKLRGRGAVVSQKTNEAFYTSDNEIHLLNLDSGADGIIWNAPEGFSFSPITALPDGSMIAFSLQERIALESRSEALHSELKEKFFKKPLGIIMIGKRNNGLWIFSEVLRENAAMNHTQLNPVDGRNILYSHEGPGDMVEQRMWLVNSDGTDRRAFRKEKYAYEHITHEFWFDDGIHAGYQSYQKQGVNFGIVSLENENEKKEYRLSVHSTHNFAKFMKNGDLMVMGDGNKNSPYIYFYFIDPAKGKIKKSFQIAERHNNTSQEYWHQHARFSPSGRYMVYGSCNELNGGDIYLIDRIPQ